MQVLMQNLSFLRMMDDNIRRVFQTLEGSWMDPPIGGYYQIRLIKEVYYKVMRSTFDGKFDAMSKHYIKKQVYMLLHLIPKVKAEFAGKCSEEEILTFIDSEVKPNDDFDKEDWVNMYKRIKTMLGCKCDETIIYYLQDIFLRF